MRSVRFENHIRSAGLSVITIPNQGNGNAMKRVEQVASPLRRSGSRRDMCARHRRAPLVSEQHDDALNIGLEREHDRSSQGRDAFGFDVSRYEEP
jgi:hypothetical protein